MLAKLDAETFVGRVMQPRTETFDHQTRHHAEREADRIAHRLDSDRDNRKRMVDSPAYRLNHEEIIKALEEGITFAENLNPVEAVPDESGLVKSVIFARGTETACGSRSWDSPAAW